MSKEQRSKEAICSIVFSTIISILFELYVYIVELNPAMFSWSILSISQISKSIVIVRFLIVFALAMSIFYIGRRQIILDNIVRYRYVIGFLLLVVLIIFNVNGSSIGMWGAYTSTENGTILGIPRIIRSDEWCMFTPLAFMQSNDPNSIAPWFSTLRGIGKSDMFMVYGQGIQNIVTIFRPFQLGYLFLGASRGLAFFWWARYILLFLVSFDFAMLITKKNKAISFIFATMILFAPVVQWWFAINGLVELITFSELAIILLDKYINTESYKKKIVYMLGILYSAIVFILVLYPAWQIPFAYVVITFIVWVLWENWERIKLTKKDIISIGIPCILFVVSLGYIFWSSKDTISLVLNSSYPGKRFFNGGGEIARTVNYGAQIFFPFFGYGVNESEVCAYSNFYDLFPLGILMAFGILFRYKIKDKLLIVLLSMSGILGTYLFIGWPDFLAKYSLLYLSFSARAIIGWQFINVVLLIRCIAIFPRKISIRQAIMIAVPLGSFVGLVSIQNYGSYLNYTKILPIVCTIIIIACMYCILRIKQRRGETIAVLFGVMFCMGFLVNPIQKGADVIFESDLAKETRKIDEKSIWLVDNITYPMTNYLLMQGIHTINGSQTYPQLEMWKLLDKDGAYYNIYNRYAHLNMKVDNSSENKISIGIAQDIIETKISEEDLKSLGVNYILTNRSLDEFNSLMMKEEVSGYKIYEVKVGEKNE